MVARFSWLTQNKPADSLPVDRLEQRAVAAYLGLAIGDALGATVEFMTPREIACRYGQHREIVGGGWLGLARGAVTDDTTMALALGESILAAGRVEAESAAQAFDRWMRAKPVDIGNTVRRGILNYRNRGQTVVPPGEHDAGNGACMRTLPVALATHHLSDEQMVAASRLQSHITHNNRLADAGTECVNRMIQQSLDGAPLNALMSGPVGRLLEEYPEYRFRGRTEQNPGGYIVETLRAVFQSLFDSDSFEGCMVEVVNRGGDADTTGAIAGMVAGAHYGLDAIPKRWLAALQPAIRGDCIRQAVALIRLSSRLSASTA